MLVGLLINLINHHNKHFTEALLVCIFVVLCLEFCHLVATSTEPGTDSVGLVSASPVAVSSTAQSLC